MLSLLFYTSCSNGQIFNVKYTSVLTTVIINNLVMVTQYVSLARTNSLTLMSETAPPRDYNTFPPWPDLLNKVVSMTYKVSTLVNVKKAANLFMNSALHAVSLL